MTILEALDALRRYHNAWCSLVPFEDCSRCLAKWFEFTNVST